VRLSVRSLLLISGTAKSQIRDDEAATCQSCRRPPENLKEITYQGNENHSALSLHHSATVECPTRSTTWLRSCSSPTSGEPLTATRRHSIGSIPPTFAWCAAW